MLPKELRGRGDAHDMVSAVNSQVYDDDDDDVPNFNIQLSIFCCGFSFFVLYSSMEQSHSNQPTSSFLSVAVSCSHLHGLPKLFTCLKFSSLCAFAFPLFIFALWVPEKNSLVIQIAGFLNMCPFQHQCQFLTLWFTGMSSSLNKPHFTILMIQFCTGPS